MNHYLAKPALMASAAIVCAIAATPATAQIKTFDIPAQEASGGISALGRQADVQIAAARKATEGKRTNGVRGTMTVDQALQQLLKGTGMVARNSGAQTFTIVTAMLTPTSAMAIQGSEGPNAFAARAPVAEEVGQNSDIIVTAGKRAEPIRQIAGSVTAQTGEQLEAMGAQQFSDYLTRVPGVAFNEGPPQNATVVIRGVGTTAGLDQGQGTTGYFINDIPLTEPGYAVIIPDIDAFDVDRVEVLRGPQGSLFGSASLGGAINYIARKADATRFDAAAEGALTSTKHGAGQIGYRAKGMINAPIVTDKLATRLIVTQRVDPGYINNVGIGRRGSNDVANLGVRGSIVFTPDVDTTINYLGLYYRTKSDDKSFAQTNVGELARNAPFAETEGYKTQIHSLRLDHDFGAATFSAIASYNRKNGDLFFNYAPITGAVNPTANHYFLQAGLSETWSFEGRLASEKGELFDWIAGATYIDTAKRFEEHLSSPGIAAVYPAATAAGLIIGDEYYFGYGDTKGNEVGLFGELSLHLGKFTLTGGGRYYNNEQTRSSGQYGFYFPTPNLISGQSLSDKGFTPKISAKYQFDNDNMIYALASKGFRFGSPNLGLLPLAGFPTPEGTTSDTLWNYEVGTRLSFLDRKLTFDLTGFWIDWTNLQVRLVRPDNFTYGANAGAARIKGLEATVDLRLGGFAYVFNGTYLDAKITESIPTAFGLILPGKRLPSSAKWRLSNTLSYMLDSPAEPTITLMHRYVSASPGYLNAPTVFPSYHMFDARVSAKVASVTLALFANNIGDRRAKTFGYSETEQFYVRPRTIGIQANWSLN